MRLYQQCRQNDIVDETTAKQSRSQLTYTLRILLANNRSLKLAQDLKPLINRYKDIFTADMFGDIFTEKLINVCGNDHTLKNHLDIIFDSFSEQLKNTFTTLDKPHHQTSLLNIMEFFCGHANSRPKQENTSRGSQTQNPVTITNKSL